MSRVIVALSGGKASAYCAKWAFENYPKDDVILYFNDTKWEHSDLYRFLSDLECYFDKKIHEDSDGRNPEELFYDNHALACNRMPFCSRILKAERLHKFFEEGDVLVFGIGQEERHRAERIVQVYQKIAVKRGVFCKLVFPIIEENVYKHDVDAWLKSTGIEEPALYKMGFEHNNCSGGCVRAGKKHWGLLLYKLPEVYADRERVETEFQAHFKKDVTILKDCSLRELRESIERKNEPFLPMSFEPVECVGICESMS